MYTKTRLGEEEVKEVTMTIYLPAQFYKAKVVLFFQFEDEEGDRFGDALIGIIDVDLPLDEDNEMLREQAVRKSSLIDENIIYAVASKLMDKGYGSFERCIQVVKACKGNEIEAEEVLTKLIFKEYKKQID
mmetsp:Transcript_35347/g.26353  ORF Transcript_35347/g.26353 Transcript_35347/m.26353 type:complete len:131 (+) Transcript_35347:1101-1493(+)|eukprot:CAMPEP_0202957898 /NCGR_PEP_ID=MMETSP1396-20130829/2273_1 /ASSEMBLY_ACC=CAM_ASM_000872 /TAXON_ID= /ORGANISM="Pseudokeronopsis sp., Strain Brazil" /LENGTH=130 /DNA_ID=CAMNT_0049675631 /DNA_START=1101 /DNA_END=1493 /DNA_ORIENTATION=+